MGLQIYIVEWVGCLPSRWLTWVYSLPLRLLLLHSHSLIFSGPPVGCIIFCKYCIDPLQRILFISSLDTQIVNTPNIIVQNCFSLSYCCLLLHLIFLKNVYKDWARKPRSLPCRWLTWVCYLTPHMAFWVPPNIEPWVSIGYCQLWPNENKKNFIRAA